MTRKRKKRWLRWVAVGVLVFAVAAVFAVRAIFHEQMGRFIAYGSYVNALESCNRMLGTLPDDLRTVEETHLAPGHRSAIVPPPPPFERPAYRPPAGLPVGEYLVIVEPEPMHWYAPHRLLIYASPDGSMIRYEFVWRWQVDERVREDDQLRERRRVSATPTTGSAAP